MIPIRTPAPAPAPTPAPAPAPTPPVAQQTDAKILEGVIGDIKDHFSRNYAAACSDPKAVVYLEERLRQEARLGGPQRAARFYRYVEELGDGVKRTQVQKQNVDAQRAWVRKYQNGEIDAVGAGSKRASDTRRIMPYTGQGALHEYDSRVPLDNFVGKGYPANLARIRNSSLDAMPRGAPSRRYLDDLDYAANQVTRSLALGNNVMQDLLLGKYHGGKESDALTDFEQKIEAINQGPTKVERSLRALQESMSAPVRALTRGLLYDKDPSRDSRLSNFRHYAADLASNNPALYLNQDQAGILASQMSLSDIYRRLVYSGVNGPITQGQFETLFQDIMDKIKAAPENQNAARKEIIKKLDDTVASISKSVTDRINQDVAEGNNAFPMHMMRGLLLLSPFCGFAILPQIAGFMFGPIFSGADLAHAFGDIAGNVPVFGQVASAVHLDDLITLVLDNFPIISQLMDFLTDILQSGVFEDFSHLVSPLLSSPLIEVFAGVAFAMTGVEPSIDRYETTQKTIKDAREKLGIKHAGLIKDLDESDQKAAAEFAQTKYGYMKTANKRARCAEFLSFLRDSNGGNDGFLDALKIVLQGAGDESAEEILSDLFGGAKVRSSETTLNAFSAFIALLDRQIAEDLVPALPAGYSNADLKERQSLVQDEYDALHILDADEVFRLRKEAINNMNPAKKNHFIQEISSAVAGSSGMHLAQEGNKILDGQFACEVAKAKFGINLDNFCRSHAAVGGKDVGLALEREVISLEVGEAIRGTAQAFNFCRAPQNRAVPSASPKPQPYEVKQPIYNNPPPLQAVTV